MRQFARICAVFLVCLLLINVMVIPASASVTAGLVTVGGLELITSAIIGLGLTYDTVENVVGWDNLISSAKEYVTSLGWIDSDGNAQVYENEYGVQYVPVPLLQKIKDWLFESNTIVEPYPYAETATIINPSKGVDSETTTYTSATPIYVYYFKAINRYGNKWFYGLAISETNLFYNGKDLKRNYDIPGVSTNDLTYVREAPYIDLGNEDPTWVTDFALNWTTATLTTTYPTGVIAGKIAPIPGTSVETNYEDWAENAIIIEFPVPPDPEEPEDPTDPSEPEEPTTPTPIKIPGFPLYIPSYPQTDVPSLPSQEEVQNPQPIEVPDPDPGVNPDPDPGVGVDPAPDIDPTLAPDNPSDGTGEPPPFIDMTMNLKNFFPFCIPYDIYDFLSILAADPVAPEFDLKLFGLGEEFTLHIDLSPFDDLAALVRSFELMGFIIGLGIITRDKFLRG